MILTIMSISIILITVNKYNIVSLITIAITAKSAKKGRLYSQCHLHISWFVTRTVQKVTTEKWKYMGRLPRGQAQVDLEVS